MQLLLKMMFILNGLLFVVVNLIGKNRLLVPHINAANMPHGDLAVLVLSDEMYSGRYFLSQ